ncbi:TPA: helix-turn-helix domain-containing protein [Pseudomonas aeruginosa]|uniref:helix-turn-helix transcriptional regulator n=1 Tax=Pseudomonas aeruginosa TaxID=287 RepID=UPI001EF208C0|nr:helix-turn-helix domain-containing protein [Pseudomonas aeruginosa]
MTVPRRKATPAPVLPDWLSASQICAKYQVSRSTLWRWAKSPGFPAPVRMGRVLRWDAGQVDTLLSKGLSADELCERYQISRTTLWRWTKLPGFPAASGIGRMLRWNPQLVDAFLSRSRPSGTEQDTSA